MPIFSTKDIFFAFVKGMLALWQMWLILGVMALIKFAYIVKNVSNLSPIPFKEVIYI